MLHLLDACIAVNIALDPIVKAATYCVQKKTPTFVLLLLLL